MTPEMLRLDALLVEALERKPRVAISEGFTARVTLEAAASGDGPALVGAPHYGVTAVGVCAALSALAMLVVAPRTTGHDPFWIVLQWMLCGQFCALIGVARPVVGKRWVGVCLQGRV